MRVVTRPRFFLDFARELLWLNKKAGPDLAKSFQNSLEETIELLSQHPLIGRERHDIRPPGVRSWRVSRFKRWLILYRVEDESLVLLRIRQGSMNLAALRMDS
jgi:plasmid stabilization system protein ParE